MMPLKFKVITVWKLKYIPKQSSEHIWWTNIFHHLNNDAIEIQQHDNNSLNKQTTETLTDVPWSCVRVIFFVTFINFLKKKSVSRTGIKPMTSRSHFISELKIHYVSLINTLCFDITDPSSMQDDSAVKWPCSPWVVIVQWIECPPGVTIMFESTW